MLLALETKFLSEEFNEGFIIMAKKLRSLAGYKPSGDYATFDVQDADFDLPPATRPPNSFCVAIAVTEEGVAIRSSRDPSKTTLFFDHTEWAVFLDGVNKGHFLPPGGIDANMP